MTTNKIRRRRRRRRRCRATKKKRSETWMMKNNTRAKKKLIMNCLFLDSTKWNRIVDFWWRNAKHTHTHTIFELNSDPILCANRLPATITLDLAKRIIIYWIWFRIAHEATKCSAIVGYRIAVGAQSSRGTSQLIRKLIIRNLWDIRSPEF